MKIYILDINKFVQPERQRFVYPSHNKDFGVEQDFLEFLNKNRALLTTNPNEADWHYLPVFWTRWHLNHDYGKFGINDLQQIVNSAIINDERTFTICQYDDGPIVDIGKTVQFLASRKSERGKDIPLLCNQHLKNFFVSSKRYLASFSGRLSTHPIRSEMANVLRGRSDICILDGDFGSSVFTQMILKSHLALAPRGYGGSSFRFFEAMQLGVVPILIGDIDTRPFKRFLPWDDFSGYIDDASTLNIFLGKKSLDDLKTMGKLAENIYNCCLTYQKWCRFVIKELEII